MNANFLLDLCLISDAADVFGPAIKAMLHLRCRSMPPGLFKWSDEPGNAGYSCCCLLSARTWTSSALSIPNIITRNERLYPTSQLRVCMEIKIHLLHIVSAFLQKIMKQHLNHIFAFYPIQCVNFVAVVIWKNRDESLPTRPKTSPLRPHNPGPVHTFTISKIRKKNIRPSS